jgi:hypothetical protein
MRDLFSENLAKIITIVILLFCVYQTGNLAKHHFAHIDDIGVADTLLNWDLCETLNIKKEKYLSTPIAAQLYLWVSENNRCIFFNKIYSFFSVPAHWTYAPFQFFFTNALYKFANWETYEDIKYLGRLPSYFSYIIAGFVFWVFLSSKRFLGLNNVYILCALLLMLMFSGEFRIMAAQMHSYSIGVLSSLLVLSVFLYTPKDACKYRDNSSTYALIYSIAISMQYQAMFLVVSCLLTFIISAKSKDIFKIEINNILKIARWMVIFLLPILPFIIKNLGKSAGTYAEGENHEFSVSAAPFLQRLGEIFDVVFRNLSENVYALLAPFELSYIDSIIFGYVISIFFLLGMLEIYKRHAEPKFHRLFILVIIYFCFNLILIFFGVMAFSPTRHALFSIVLILIVVGCGFYFVSCKFTKFGVDRLIFLGILVACFYSLIIHENFAISRIDGVSEEHVEQVFPRTAVDIVIGDGVEFKLMKNIKNNYLLFDDINLCEKLNKIYSETDRISVGIFLRSDVPIADRLLFIDSKCGLSGNYKSSFSLKELYVYAAGGEVEFSKKTKNGSNKFSYYNLVIHK